MSGNPFNAAGSSGPAFYHEERRRATLAPTFDMILAGHFHEGRGYATWRERGTDDWLLIATQSGAGRLGHRAGEIMVTLGDIILLQPGALHDYGTDPSAQEWELLWAHFRPYPHWLPWLDWPREAPGLMRLRIDERPALEAVLDRLGEVYRLTSGGLRRREAFALNRLEAAFLLCDLHNPLSEHSGIDTRVQRALDFLCRNLGRSVTPVDLGAECGLSPSRLAHLFREQVGMTPQQFLEAQRLTRARQLLELTSRTVEAVAYEVGYENPFYFSLRFKKVTGVSPREYRRRFTASRD